VIIVDANLLIYAVNSDAPQHGAARPWLESLLSGREQVGFAWVVILAFLRITTRSGIFDRPLAPETALDLLEEMLAQPVATTVSPGERHWPILRNLLADAGTLGNLSSDAHLAALTIENGATLHSADYDFLRFPGLRHCNPLMPE